MKRLSSKQKQHLREHYWDHWLYAHFASAAKEMERRLDLLRISPEELFVECVMQLDRFLQAPETYVESVAGPLWDDYYCQLREESPSQTTRRELELGASELCYAMNYLFCAMDNKLMSASAMSCLTLSLMSHADSFDEVTRCFQPKLWTANQDSFAQALQRYVEEGAPMSHTIARQLEEWATSPAPILKEGQEDEADHDNDLFTIRQTIILIQELLNISLSAQDTNIKELSRFIHRLTGKQPESIRSAINKLAKQPQTPSKDLNLIASQIEIFNPGLARAIRSRND